MLKSGRARGVAQTYRLAFGIAASDGIPMHGDLYRQRFRIVRPYALDNGSTVPSPSCAGGWNAQSAAVPESSGPALVVAASTGGANRSARPSARDQRTHASAARGFRAWLEQQYFNFGASFTTPRGTRLDRPSHLIPRVRAS